MRGSFKQRSVEPFSVALSLTSPLRLFRLFALQSANLSTFLIDHVFVRLEILFSFSTQSLFVLKLRYTVPSPGFMFLSSFFFFMSFHNLTFSLTRSVYSSKKVSRGVIVVVYSVLEWLLILETCAVCNILAITSKTKGTVYSFFLSFFYNITLVCFCTYCSSSSCSNLYVF